MNQIIKIEKPIAIRIADNEQLLLEAGDFIEILGKKPSKNNVNENKSALRKKYQHKNLNESRNRNHLSESRKKKLQEEFRKHISKRIREMRAPREYKVKVRTSSYSWGD
ncbi:MAG: hypothetical protein ACTSVV_09810 [Promethearchaeota archaeon]